MIVEVTDGSGCKGYDTITVKVDNANKRGYLMSNAFTPNDGGVYVYMIAARTSCESKLFRKGTFVLVREVDFLN